MIGICPLYQPGNNSPRSVVDKPLKGALKLLKREVPEAIGLTADTQPFISSFQSGQTLQSEESGGV